MLRLYPKTIYKIDDFDYIKISDITFYYKIKEFIRSFAFENGRNYMVRNGESPASLSYNMYGTPRFDYLILVLNDIYNIYDEWPKSDSDFLEYIIKKYGSVETAKTTVFNYFRSDGIKVSEETWNSLVDGAKYTESYFDYEAELNSEKAKIKLVEFNMMLNFEVELRKLISSIISKENDKVFK